MADNLSPLSKLTERDYLLYCQLKVVVFNSLVRCGRLDTFATSQNS